MRRGYVDEGRVHIGAFVAPDVKRQLVDRAYSDRVSISEVIRLALHRELSVDERAA